jgi:hypothetical protein
MKAEGRLGRAMRHEILQCLRVTQQMCGAARLLDLGRQTLYNHVEAFGIVQSDWRGVPPLVESGPASQSLLLKELAQLIARYSPANGAAPTAIRSDNREASWTAVASEARHRFCAEHEEESRDSFPFHVSVLTI